MSPSDAAFERPVSGAGEYTALMLMAAHLMLEHGFTPEQVAQRLHMPLSAVQASVGS